MPGLPRALTLRAHAEIVYPLEGTVEGVEFDLDELGDVLDDALVVEYLDALCVWVEAHLVWPFDAACIHPGQNNHNIIIYHYHITVHPWE